MDEEATQLANEAIRAGGSVVAASDTVGAVAESVDLLYHMLVLSDANGVPAGDVCEALAARVEVSAAAPNATRDAR